MKQKITVPRLLLDTKIDIPFPQAQLVIHQPSIEEIGLCGGEPVILPGIMALTKDYKTIQDNSDLAQFSNFQILMKIITDKTVKNNQSIFNSIYQTLFLLFPKYKITFTPSSILVIEEDSKQVHMIDDNNFQDLQDIIYDVFCIAELGGSYAGDDYNPGGDRARAIVEKFRKKREYLAELRKQQGDDAALKSIYGRYLNILAVGLQKDKNELKKYSIYQLIEEFHRYQLKMSFDYTFQAKLAGATKIKDAKDWMDDIQFGINKQED